MKVWIVTETIGMTIEGDTEIRAVYATEEAAQAAVAKLGQWDAGAGSYEVRETFDPDQPFELNAWQVDH